MLEKAPVIINENFKFKNISVTKEYVCFHFDVDGRDIRIYLEDIPYVFKTIFEAAKLIPDYQENMGKLIQLSSMFKDVNLDQTT